ncbi:DNA ligase [Streptacidiphilus sp. N1-3]|uniref:DNA ligase n=1 Tax=Streptacidiphilus alkalitolerans TaxID=3342712 RepID=A0ABV6X1M5_9ACTN
MSSAKPVLQPPLEVMRPRAVAAIPEPDSLPGGVRYEIKLDGYRCLAFARGPEPPVLQSRSGRDMAADFPAIAAAVARLPAGLVLDGEVCAWKDGRLAFGALRTPAARTGADGMSLALVVFDLLALPGRDIRPLPLRERVALLDEVLKSGTPPGIQAVLATTDEAEARHWYETLEPQGIEGLVCKALDSPYLPGGAGRYWRKVRHHDTVDAVVLAITGTPRRPRLLLLQLADGARVLTSSQLDPPQARTVGEALAGLIGAPEQDPDFGPVRPLTEPVTAEVTTGTGRHIIYRFIRLRGD